MQYIETCPVGCESDLQETQVVLPEGALLCCTQCGQLLSQCSQDHYWNTMQEFDSYEGTWPGEKSKKRSFQVHTRRLKQLARMLDKPLSDIDLLDVGCSTGAFLHSAMRLGVRAQGVEPAPKAVDRAREAGLIVHQGMVQDQDLPANSFDVVTLFEVIEHLKEPRVILDAAFELLKPGGLMMIGTGNAQSWTANFMKHRWEYFQIALHGGHISFYSPASLSKLAKSVGFEVANISTRRVRFFEKNQISNLLYRVAKFSAELLNLPATLLKKGHDMTVILRKPQS